MFLWKLYFTPKYLYVDSGTLVFFDQPGSKLKLLILFWIIYIHLEAIVSDFTNANRNCIYEALGIKMETFSFECDPSFYFNKCFASFPSNISMLCKLM